MSIVLVLKDFNYWFNFSNHYSVTLFYLWIDNHLDVSTTPKWNCYSYRNDSYRYNCCTCYPVERKSEGISLFSLSLVLGSAIGPFFGILLLKSFSINLLFLICLILGIASLIVSVFIKIDFNPTKNAIDRKVAQASGFNIHNFIAKEAVPVAIVMMIIGLNYASILTFLKSFAEQRHLLEASSYFFIFYAIASLITRPIAGRMIDAKMKMLWFIQHFLP